MLWVAVIGTSRRSLFSSSADIFQIAVAVVVVVVDLLVGRVVAVVFGMLCSGVVKISCLSFSCEVGSRDISLLLFLSSGSGAFSLDASLLLLLAFTPDSGPMTKQ